MEETKTEFKISTYRINRLLTSEQVMDILQIRALSTLRKLFTDYNVPVVRVAGSSNRFDPKDIAELIEKLKHTNHDI